MEAKNEFMQIYKENIHREGADKLLEWLARSDMFTAPASTQYHLSCAGGLCQHSVNVYKQLCTIYEAEYGAPQNDEVRESLAIIALLHDVCKINFYKPGTRNVKNEAGKWESVPCYTIDDQLPYGHGEKSVYIINGFMRLTRDEAMAIRWHMGAWDDAVRGGSRAYGQAAGKHPLIILLHVADQLATYIDEANE